jgi:hypothetical protein
LYSMMPEPALGAHHRRLKDAKVHAEVTNLANS